MYGGWGDLSGEGVRGGRSVFSALSFLALVFISQCLAYPSFSFMLPICCSVLLLALFFFRLFIISPLRHNRCLHPHLYTRLCFCVSARRPHISSILLHPSPSLSHFPSVTFSCCFVAVCSIPSRLFPSHSLFCRLDRTSMLFMFFSFLVALFSCILLPAAPFLAQDAAAAQGSSAPTATHHGGLRRAPPAGGGPAGGAGLDGA